MPRPHAAADGLDALPVPPVSKRATRPRAPRGSVRLDGVRRGARTLVMRALGRTVYRRLLWLELRLDAPFPSAVARVPLETGFLEPADADAIAALRGDLSVGAIAARFAAGERCYGAWHDGRLVSCSWVSAGVARVEYLGLARRLPADAVYHYERWTDPGSRGLRIAPATGAALCRALAGEGVALVAATILPENRAGLANVHRAGYVQTATIGWIGAAPLRRRFFR